MTRIAKFLYVHPAFYQRRLSNQAIQPSPVELQYQEQWLARLNLSPESFQSLRQKGIAKGVAFGSARRSQEAADVQFGDFTVGAFTYLLTRYLWQQQNASPLNESFAYLASATRDLAQSSGLGQNPIHEVQPGTTFERRPIYFLAPIQRTAEAVVQAATGDRVELWLGGMDPRTLSTVGTFEVINSRGAVVGEVELSGRRGLVGRGRVSQGQARAGMLLREKIRGLPAQMVLNLGLDENLGQQQAIAQTILQAEPRLNLASVKRISSVDFWLGRMTPDRLEMGLNRKIANLGTVGMGSIGLFSAGLVPIESSFGSPNETIEAACDRLRPNLMGLLCGKILASLENSAITSLKVAMNLIPVKGQASAVSSRGAQEAGPLPETRRLIGQQVKIKDQVRVEIQNLDRIPLYLSLLSIGSDGHLNFLDSQVVPPGTSLKFPYVGIFTVQEPAGFFELYAIASPSPIQTALQALQRLADQSRGAQAQVDSLDNFLSDLDQSTRSSRPMLAGYKRIDLQKIAIISTIIEAVS